MDHKDCTIEELRAAILLLKDVEPKQTNSNMDRWRHASDFAHAAWVNSASFDVKALVQRLGRARNPEVVTYVDAVKCYGRSIVIEAEQALK